MIRDEMSSRDSSGLSMRAWLHMGAAMLALMLLALSDRIVDESPPQSEEVEQHLAPESARHTASRSAGAAIPERGVMEVVSRVPAR